MIQTSFENFKKTSSYRFHYFVIHIFTGIQGSQSYQILNSPSLILNIFEQTNFIPQSFLEESLKNLIIEEGGRKISLTNFIGQLEVQRSDDFPYWKIYCETSSPTTAPSVARALSKKLFSNKDLNLENHSIDPRIKVKHQTTFGELNDNLRISVPLSDWYPGYFTKEFASFFDLLEKIEVNRDKFLQNLEKRPKVKTILLQLTNSTSD
jgi:hypothetical protein